MSADTGGQHTLLVDEYRRAAKSEFANYSYKGLRIHALPGLHEFTFARVKEHVKMGATILDLAAGSGAMSKRLIDSGYNVIATDYVVENFRLHDSVPFFMADLNAGFSKGREQNFDAIVASEIIEHLENPRHFARECFKLLKPEGFLILSTPNVDCAASVAHFISDSTFQWFSDASYDLDGHITPLTQWQLDKCFKEAGFDAVWNGSFGDRHGLLRGSPRLLLLSKLIDKLMKRKNELRNQIFVSVMRRGDLSDDV
jgi:2-polyprenyl-3-methyl-5-hydroxy-6-metoxy-1,4-benzoquinol methylase